MGLNDLTLLFGAQQLRIIAVVGLLLGLGHCFCGYRIFRFILALGGFVLGAALGYVGAQGAGVTPTSGIFVSLLLGVAFAYVSYFAYKVGVFLHSGAVGFIIGSIYSSDSAVILVGTLALAICAVLLVKPVVILYTGVSGGLLAGAAIALLQGQRNWSPVDLPSTVLIVAGIIFQFWSAQSVPVTLGTEPIASSTDSASQI